MTSPSTSTPQVGCCHRLQVPPFPEAKVQKGDPYYEPEDITNIDLGDVLDNETIELNPLFRPEAFTGFSASDYDAIIPVLRLVSVYLKSPRAIRFLHTILFGQIWRSNVSGEHTLADTVKGSLSPMEELAMTRSWQAWSKVLTFACHNTEVSANCQGAYDRASAYFQGYGSIVNIPRGYIQKFSVFWCARSHDSSAGNKMAILHTAYDLATTIVHELAHSAWSLRAGYYPEPHLDEFGSATELGFAMETVVFGGFVHEQMLPRNGFYTTAPDGNKLEVAYTVQLVLIAWPNPDSVMQYQEKKLAISTRGDISGFIGIANRLYMAEVARRCTQAYWDAETVGCITHANASAPNLETPEIVCLTNTLPLNSLPGQLKALKQIAGGYETFARGIYGVRQIDALQHAIRVARKYLHPAEARKWVEDVEGQQNVIRAAVARQANEAWEAAGFRLAEKRQGESHRLFAASERISALKQTPAGVKKFLAKKWRVLRGKSQRYDHPWIAPELVLEDTSEKVDLKQLKDELHDALQVPVSIVPARAFAPAPTLEQWFEKMQLDKA